MSNWKLKAPAELAVPSSGDSIEHLSKLGSRPQSLVSSPFSGGGVQQFPILAPENLRSPDDPAGFLEGTSSLARFGLDIGGTLCKVVYFEPAVDVMKDSSKASKVQQATTDSSAEAFASSKVGKENLALGANSRQEDIKSDANDDFVSNDDRPVNSLNASTDKLKIGFTGNEEDRKLPSLTTQEDDAIELTTSGLHQLTLSNSCSPPCSPTSLELQSAVGVQVDSDQKVENGQEGGNGNTTDAVSESCHCSCGTQGIQVLDHQRADIRTPNGVGGGEDAQNSQRQARKLWVSTHEPVDLPGRGTLYFKCFETWRMEEFLNLTKEHHLVNGGRAIGATGGGARKFGDQFLEIAQLQLQRADELKSLVLGIDFLARHAHQESFEYPTGSYQGGAIQRPWESPENSSDDGSDISSEDVFSLVSCKEGSELKTSSPITQFTGVSNVEPTEKTQRQRIPKGPTLKWPVLARLNSGVWIGSNEPLHPYLLVNIGSGVSILRVDSAEKFERVGGTSLGGSTFLGLASALTGCESFEEAINLAMQGDSTHIDMLVGDIYGGDYTEMGLAATTVASSFGKLVQPRKSAEMQQPQHLAKAALLMVTNNIGSIAMLHARNAAVHSIMFTGSFLHNNKLAMRLLSVAMDFWSKGNMKAVFLRHEGHAGAVGALLSQLESSNPLDALLLK